jgi:C1A family cysteine protease
MQPVKNQGSCGSCWTFSAICPLEFSNCKKTGYAVALSEQQLVDCDPYDGGCNGGWYYNAWYYLKAAGGADRASSYGYTGARGNCRFNSAAVGARVSSYQQIAANPTAMMTALQKGPISVAFTVVDSLNYYGNGIYADSTCNQQPPNHAVVAVGYGSVSGYDYWVIRNSWGPTWAVGGYFFIQKGVNMCNIESYAYSVVAA